MSEAKKEIALTFVEALGNGDAEMVKTVIADDLVAVAKGTSVASGSRNYAEIIAIFDMFSKLTQDGSQPDDPQRHCRGRPRDRRMRGKVHPGQRRSVRHQYVHVFFLRDGKIHELHEYFDTKLTDDVPAPLTG